MSAERTSRSAASSQASGAHATIQVALGSRSYEVLIGPGLIDAAGGLIET